jgi:hypothetical protein
MIADFKSHSKAEGVKGYLLMEPFLIVMDAHPSTGLPSDIGELFLNYIQACSRQKAIASEVPPSAP